MSLISKPSVPDVPAEQKAFDQAHKHLCKLRWIGQDVDSEYVFTVLRAAGLVSQPRVKSRLRSVPAPGIRLPCEGASDVAGLSGWCYSGAAEGVRMPQPSGFPRTQSARLFPPWRRSR